ncbi:hypothetical protein [Candidatus Nanohalococcus occultus]|uniref:Uncharacterized protein n=1 Tax=Candidatus Nanohalococcus occultus TaxID=2978047 RepID=A0ABY8CEG6_9ARCH|nr:hypothetical protein SVXNc_0591 [Candidatus Nanohaloarchaeota archaeon SVXNc]
MKEYEIDKLLTDGENIEFDLLKDENGYRIDTSMSYEGERLELAIRSIQTDQELESFYRKYVEGRSGDRSVGIYGNSDRLEKENARTDSWALTSNGEWSVDIYRALKKYMKDSDNPYRAADHIAATTSAAISFSESSSERRNEDYSFYMSLVADPIERQKPAGFTDRMKARAAERAKKEAVSAALSAKEDLEAEWRRMKREGEIEELKRKARETAKDKAKELAVQTKNSAKNRTRSALDSKIDQLRQSLRSSQTREDEGPEPRLTVRKDNGITIYDYRDADNRYEEK